ncbi:coiled-coil domain-containing protein [Nocardiopsis lambiniae]|uniref:Membrane fusogenic activity family protein n=1 Tax=Nocardiopsis lambiniae TaxID=3075539 RepID=A0ABU2MCL5_9ACTN|nr:membrane fusogenic activity family protein [Nocardiopsis sp. DSM 44743]MDT0330324.1 membrane fusogenic activity family protein [Nocardiopsis sp. DSM 44743]
MVVDAVRTYLDAANGLTELSRKEAVAAAKTLLRASGPSAPVGEAGAVPPRVGQSIQALAGELLETSRANREALAELVRAEVEHRLERMDVVPRAEHERLVRRVAELERRLAARQGWERPVAVPAPQERAEETPVAPEPVPAAVLESAPVVEEGADVASVSEAEAVDVTGSEAPGDTAAGSDTEPDAGSEDKPGARKKATPAKGTAAKTTRARGGTAKRTTKARSSTKK